MPMDDDEYEGNNRIDEASAVIKLCEEGFDRPSDSLNNTEIKNFFNNDDEEEIEEEGGPFE